MSAYTEAALAAKAERDRNDEEARRARWFAGTSTSEDGVYGPVGGGGGSSGGGEAKAAGGGGGSESRLLPDARGNWGEAHGWEKRRGMEAAFAERRAASLASMPSPPLPESVKAHALVDKFYQRMPPPDSPPAPQAPASHLDPAARAALDEAMLSEDAVTQSLFLGLPQGGGGLKLPETTKTVGRSGRLLCSALYTGAMCERVRKLPACIAGEGRPMVLFDTTPPATAPHLRTYGPLHSSVSSRSPASFESTRACFVLFLPRL